MRPSAPNEGDYNPEVEVDISFKLVVSLAPVAMRTGEENEECLFSHRVKLYRFDSQTNQWKERGVGDIKILKNTTNGRARVVMKRDQILKICCNHFILPDMTLRPNMGSDKSWIWQTLSDFTKESPREEKLSVKFKHAQKAQEFKTIFDSFQVPPELPKEKGREPPPQSVLEAGAEGGGASSGEQDQAHPHPLL